MLDIELLNLVAVTKFEDRLEEALTLAGKTAKQLAAVLVGPSGQVGVSVQTVYAAKKGTTNSFTAENCARAARFLGVDLFWFATGLGSPRETNVQTLDTDQTYVLEKMRKMSRYHVEMLIVATDAFTGPFADRATMSITYAPRALLPSAAPALGQETPGG